MGVPPLFAAYGGSIVPGVPGPVALLFMQGEMFCLLPEAALRGPVSGQRLIPPGCYVDCGVPVRGARIQLTGGVAMALLERGPEDDDKQPDGGEDGGEGTGNGEGDGE